MKPDPSRLEWITAPTINALAMAYSVDLLPESLEFKVRLEDERHYGLAECLQKTTSPIELVAT